MGRTRSSFAKRYVNGSCSSGRFSSETGWEQFTDAVIHTVAERLENVVFILWGNYAISKGEFIDSRKHLILKSVHPSPLSASRGFFGNKQFSTANSYLLAHGKEPIQW